MTSELESRVWEAELKRRAKLRRLSGDQKLKELLDVTSRWIVSHRKGIPHYRIGGSYRYDLESREFKAWLEGQKR